MNPSGDISYMDIPTVGSEDPASEFLSRAEKNQIQTNYERILDNIKEQELLLALHSAKFISPREKTELGSKSPGQVQQYIVDEVFMKATYSQIKVIREILKNSQTPSHVELAKLLPIRGEDTRPRVNSAERTPFSQPVQGSSPHTNYFQFPHNQVRRASEQLTLLHPPVQEGQYHSDTNNYDSDSSGQEMQSVYRGAGGYGHSPSNPNLLSKGITKLKNSFRKKKGSKTWNSSPDVSSAVAPPLGCYGVKDDNNPVYGNSVCFVIVNFTEDLTGYQIDAEDIVQFHKTRLQCDKVFAGKLGKLSMKDLTKEKFMEVLRAIQGYLLNDITGGEIDRFFLYILSHGDEDGIMMCQEESRCEEEGYDKDGKPIRVQMQDIVDMFTHDQVPTLKTFPKVFINQSCQGTEILRAAGPTPMDSPDSSIRKRQPWKPPQMKLAVGADVIICDATSHHSISWVSEGGSLFIQTLIEVMGAYLCHEAFYDILVEVNNRISHKVKKGLHPTDNKIIPASQMPKIHSQLTQKFYLARQRQKTRFY